MSKPVNTTGSCQCGAITYRIAGDLPPAYACHCSECKKQSASAFSLSIAIPFARLDISGEPESFETVAYSGAMKMCYFCSSCGTRMWHRSANAPDNATLKVGTIDGRQDISPTFHLWVSKKQDGFTLDPSARAYDTQPDNLLELREAMGR